MRLLETIMANAAQETQRTLACEQSYLMCPPSTRRSTLRKFFALAIVAVVSAWGVQSLHAQSGADTYKGKCMMCHGADGSGNTPAGKSMKAIPFTSPDLVKATDADLIAATLNGKGKMPAYSGKLTPAQVKEVIAYIRTLQK
jgi:mono/diheme cytochrome c family protein